MISPLQPQLPAKTNDYYQAGQLYGSAQGLLLANVARYHNGPVLVLTDSTASAHRLEMETRFYMTKQQFTILHFPDWETLPYDRFSPHQDIIAERMETLQQLPHFKRGIVFVPITTIMHRITPREFLDSHNLVLNVGDTLNSQSWQQKLERVGYQRVSQVTEYGEFAVRGAIIDIYPMGSQYPYRVDLFDDEIDSLRTFDPDTQRSINITDSIQFLPAREFAITNDSIMLFRHQFRQHIGDNCERSLIYQEISAGNIPNGIEYYLPLFFQHTNSVIDYLADNVLMVSTQNLHQTASDFWQEVSQRHQQYADDQERPILPPDLLFFKADELFASFKHYQQLYLQAFELAPGTDIYNYATVVPPQLTLSVKHSHSSDVLRQFINEFHGRILFVAETLGRREIMLDLLRNYNLAPNVYLNWDTFLADDKTLGITVAPLEHGLVLPQIKVAVIAESQLFGEQVMQRRRRNRKKHNANAVIGNLAELTVGDAVVHEDHGVGRYLGLQPLDVGDITAEYVILEYAEGDKLYVPIAALDLISRYSGVSSDLAPLHKLGSGQWERARRKAAQKARDVAVELLDVYAQRAACHKLPLDRPDDQYARFAVAFPFEVTVDQQDAIDDVIADIASDKPMDRLICGDVGFGKTEVAMRAAFLAVQSGKQVMVLVPTTLLAQQHYENFKDRFADWPVHIEIMSRFRSKKQLDTAKTNISNGTADIIIGTHKLIQQDINPKQLGLFILDEEHRFGVTQKEHIKKYRTEIDVLTLTATPIPRTLNMSMSGIRDLSVIATPPARRLAIKTFVQQWHTEHIREGILREIRRGGQVYFLHNKVADINRIAREIEQIMPEAKVGIAHGQMRERELEHIMLDFYHQRFNVLICTTIIETGIDIPSANTIFINRADKLGLAQLYQIRGRVGRSHHRAYAYLLVPPEKAMTKEAVKRLQAIESIEDLGAGFNLATHDMEIRGVGELLGDEQSGQIQEIGFGLYNELLKRAVSVLQSGKQHSLNANDRQFIDIDLHTPALIPVDYLPDIHARLMLYKRIAATLDNNELDELQSEIIDRFGLLPAQAQILMAVQALRFKAKLLAIRRIVVHDQGGRITFAQQSAVDPATIIQLIQSKPSVYKLDGQDKLRFIGDLPEPSDRIAVLDQLLDRLSQPV